MQTSSHPAFYRESLSEDVEASGAGSDQVEASKRSYGDLPLIVLTSVTGPQPPRSLLRRPKRGREFDA